VIAAAEAGAGGGVVDGLVSTVIPVRDRPLLLADAVVSVLAQEYRPIEILIVDDGSTDDTVEVAEGFAGRHPDVVRVLRQANAGPGLAREAGRAAARGEFVQYLDSDDVVLPGKFARQVAGLRELPNAGASYGWTRLRRADGGADEHPYKESGVRHARMFPAMLRSRWWDTGTALYRAALLHRAGPWTDLRLEEDWEYDCRVAALDVELHYVPAFVSEYRDHALPRLGRGAALDPERLRERARAHRLILGHARRAGIGADAPEMAHFARELFLLARQCGAAGLAGESRVLFALARDASGPARGAGADFVAYRALAGVAGWVAAGKLAVFADRFRRAPGAGEGGGG
jgi:glycosyltransferase involved in cell wall biosynthesis